MNRKLLLLVLAGLFSLSVYAEPITQVTEGISGLRDKYGRDPILTVSREVIGDSVQILVDTQVSDDELQKYPIRYDFFINRNFVTSQIRSPELPGPIGITVGKETTLPFTYTVMATIIHPSRTFSSVINGAAYANEITSAALTCSVTYQTLTYTTENVTLIQSAEGQLALNLKAELEDESDVTVSGTVLLSDSQASSTLTVEKDGQTESIETSGTVEKEGNTVEELSLADSTDKITINCQ